MLSEHYLLIKTIHVGCAIVSLTLFTGRGLWKLSRPKALIWPWLRVVPHMVDTVLLGSALMLVMITWQYPGKDAWLTAKLAALVIYIVLGTIALKRGRTHSIRLTAFLGALLSFAYVVSVAVIRDPPPLNADLIACGRCVRDGVYEAARTVR